MYHPSSIEWALAVSIASNVILFGLGMFLGVTTAKLRRELKERTKAASLVIRQMYADLNSDRHRARR